MTTDTTKPKYFGYYQDPNAKFPSCRVALLGGIGVGLNALLWRFITRTFFPHLYRNDGQWGSMETDDLSHRVLTVDDHEWVTDTNTWYLPDDADEDARAKYRVENPIRDDAVLVVYDITSRASFNQVAEYVAWARCRSEAAKSIPEIPEEYPMILIGLNNDFSKSREVEAAEGEQLSTELGIRGGYLELSLRSGENVDTAFQNLVRMVWKDRVEFHERNYCIKEDGANPIAVGKHKWLGRLKDMLSRRK